MSKRRARTLSNAVWTPPEAATPLFPHLAPVTRFIEPCAGAGDLIHVLEGAGHVCSMAFDIAPPADVAHITGVADARTHDFRAMFAPHLTIITNPPWDRDLLHPIIANLAAQFPTWLLFQSDWRCTEQSTPFRPYMRRTLDIGRVSWMRNGQSGFENCTWYLFDATPEARQRHAPGCLHFTRWDANPAGYPAPPPHPERTEN